MTTSHSYFKRQKLPIKQIRQTTKIKISKAKTINENLPCQFRMPGRQSCQRKASSARLIRRTRLYPITWNDIATSASAVVECMLKEQTDLTDPPLSRRASQSRATNRCRLMIFLSLQTTRDWRRSSLRCRLKPKTSKTCSNSPNKTSATTKRKPRT